MCINRRDGVVFRYHVFLTTKAKDLTCNFLADVLALVFIFFFTGVNLFLKVVTLTLIMA